MHLAGEIDGCSASAPPNCQVPRAIRLEFFPRRNAGCSRPRLEPACLTQPLNHLPLASCRRPIAHSSRCSPLTVHGDSEIRSVPAVISLFDQHMTDVRSLADIPRIPGPRSVIFPIIGRRGNKIGSQPPLFGAKSPSGLLLSAGTRCFASIKTDLCRPRLSHLSQYPSCWRRWCP